MKVSRKGVPRVVWERRRPSTDPGEEDTIDLIPFLSMSRSLGDFWSFNEQTQKFVVSPNPDVQVHSLDPSTQKFIVLASDGLWNVMTPQEVVDFVWAYEQGERCMENGEGDGERDVVRALIDEALERWQLRKMFADNIAVVIAFLKEEGAPPPASVPGLTRSSEPAVASTETANSSDNVVLMPSPEKTDAERRKSQTKMIVSPQEPAVIHHVSTYWSGSTVYHKECQPNGSCFELHTKISLRCRRKDKKKLREQHRRQLAVTLGPEKAGEGEKSVSPGKRSREDPDDVQLPPSKKSHHEGDSGCESDGDGDRDATIPEKKTRHNSLPSPSTNTLPSSSNNLLSSPSNNPLSSPTNGRYEPSSGVFSEDSSPGNVSEPVPLIG